MLVFYFYCNIFYIREATVEISNTVVNYHILWYRKSTRHYVETRNTSRFTKSTSQRHFPNFIKKISTQSQILSLPVCLTNTSKKLPESHKEVSYLQHCLSSKSQNIYGLPPNVHHFLYVDDFIICYQCSSNMNIKINRRKCSKNEMYINVLFI